ncbi:MAG: hypothetical protein DCC43_11430 [Candidatus Brocadia sp.]|jgi:uncharacterized membrane protein (UPF0127 family)|uniref:DUF192 domain-containing protein n=1 Tax=Candidatus Brocadia fulgida TaxID=380242 RepID=A0A0M2UUA0_9BACT|nr:MAG: hypothetical protein BROFUL_01653 [Candidatus Brocadia fulgida]MCC6324973.1 DUF192 domain-containing protein [Candidatus Brocadia sp.]MCE7910716.1 DUF192 domain-containing protein [Candidatus Brocadia sp. AMX3]OQZ01756.1 MAG: hypothetical protein B6D35_02230 [Candidatus Brocadia sp. UTAMX2]MBV6518836.1 hypothetical protein [Candidatus Brocadia fulgida]
MDRDKKYVWFSLSVLFICAGICAGVRDVCGEALKRNKVLPINVAGIELEIELATTSEEQILGLMYRDTLDDDGGMLFVFPKEKHVSFWMKNTRIPLSIAFIKADGRIMQIESMKPYSLDSHVSREKVKYALEMKDGWFQARKVKEGDIVRIPQAFDGKGE